MAGKSLWDDPAFVIADLIPRTPGLNLGSPTAPFETIYADQVVGASLIGDSLFSPDQLSSVELTDAAINFNLDTGNTLYFNVGGVPKLDFNGTQLFPNVDGGVDLGSALNAFGSVYLGLGKTLGLKSGVNGKAGTVTLNGVTPVAVATTAFKDTSVVIFGLKTVGGTVGAYPVLQTATPNTGFTVAGTAADTSVYSWIILDLFT